MLARSPAVSARASPHPEPQSRPQADAARAHPVLTGSSVVPHSCANTWSCVDAARKHRQIAGVSWTTSWRLVSRRRPNPRQLPRSGSSSSRRCAGPASCCSCPTRVRNSESVQTLAPSAAGVVGTLCRLWMRLRRQALPNCLESPAVSSWTSIPPHSMLCIYSHTPSCWSILQRRCSVFVICQVPTCWRR